VSDAIGQKVYGLRYGEGYEWLLPAHESDFERLRFDGQPRASGWVPVEMKRLTASERGRPLVPADFYACSGGDMLVFGDHAREVIGPTLEQYGELLPLSCEGRRFWTLNVTSFVDALDEGASLVVRASETGRLLMVRRHAFKAAPLRGAELFKLPQTPRGLIYATESFAERLRESKLVGLELAQLWAPN
jgi:hypothetical protein